MPLSDTAISSFRRARFGNATQQCDARGVADSGQPRRFSGIEAATSVGSFGKSPGSRSDGRGAGCGADGKGFVAPLVAEQHRRSCERLNRPGRIASARSTVPPADHKRSDDCTSRSHTCSPLSTKPVCGEPGLFVQRSLPLTRPAAGRDNGGVEGNGRSRRHLSEERGRPSTNRVGATETDEAF